MKGRACALFAAAACLALAALGCSERYAPDEAPPLASVATIPVAAPGAVGVAFESPRPYGATTGRPTEELDEPPVPLPKEAAPQPLPGNSAPNPFVEPAPTPAPTPLPTTKKKDGSGTTTGPVSKGVQL